MNSWCSVDFSSNSLHSFFKILNQFNIIKIYTVFTQQQDTNTIQVPIDYKPGDAGTYQPGD